MSETVSSRPRLVVLGCGFGAYSTLAALPRDLYDVTVVSPTNYFLFTPLLPSAVSGTVELRSILEPVRRRLRHVRLIEAAAEEISFDERRVACRGAVGGEAFEIGYDVLVIAVGASVADYGIPGVAEHALTLVDVADGRRLRRGLLEQFARAEIPGLSADEVRRRLTFVVCGGGPTGVEVAAEIDDLLDRELKWMHRDLAASARVVLVEATARLLTSFDEALAAYTRDHFVREGVEVRTSAPVVRLDADRVVLEGGEEIPYGLAVWAGGNAPRDLIRRLGIDLDRSGRLPVDERLRLPGLEDVYALGDCAAVGEPSYPATAQVAQKQGRYLGRALARRARGRAVPGFEYRPSGMLAYIGGGRALADLPQVKWSGRAAWLFWRSVYLTRLVSLSNKVKVLFDWLKARLLGRDLSRF